MSESSALRCREIFAVTLRLGVTSFGGPAAHLGYFRREFVERLRWVDETEFADLLALCQFLPGPASSQLGFAVGYRRGGLPGAMVAWIGFTLPSAVLMLLFAGGLKRLGAATTAGWLHGLKAVAVAVVAHAVWQMARTLCPDWPRRLLAAGAAIVMVVAAGRVAWLQVAVIAVAAVIGGGCLRREPPAVVALGERSRRRTGAAWLAGFAVLLVGLPVLAAATGNGWLAVADRFYRVGALVFGGGHVVLPLLEAEVVTPGWVNHETFLAGYGVAQALPGPLFTFAAYLGAAANVGPGGWIGGTLALGAIFLPGLLLVLGCWPFWQRLRGAPMAGACIRGTNAAVVGLLAAALINPVAPAGLRGLPAGGVALAGLAALCWGRVPVWVIVAGAAVVGQFAL